MLKQIYELFTQLFTFTHRLNRQDETIERLQQELKANSELNNRLVFEHIRTNDELKRLAEREAEARKLFQLQVENQLLRAGHPLPPVAEARPVAELPAPLDQDETLQLKTQVAELLAAVRKADEQRARDQAEIERLKAQMAALLAEPPKKDT
jgi:hypothetical protein